MPQKTLRTIGALVILTGLGVAAIIQIRANREQTPAEIVTAEPTTTTSPEPSTTVSEPFVYRVGVLSGVTTDNFWAFYGEQPSAWNAYILGPTKPALFTSDVVNGTLRPELAVSTAEPERESDTWQVTVRLNPEFAWSDANPITAHDLVFTFDTVRALNLGGSWADSFPKTVKDVTAVGDHEVRIEFTRRPQLSVWPHGVGLAPVMARHVWEASLAGITRKQLYKLAGDQDVSGGALAVSSVSEELVVSHANPGYPLVNAPDTVEYHVYPDETTAVSALGEGRIDSVLSPKGLADEHLEEVADVPGVEIIDNPGNAIRYLGFNLDRDPMSERAFRTSLALLLDRERLSESVEDGGPAAWSLVPEANTQWFDPAEVEARVTRYTAPLAERLDSALKLLEKTGYQWADDPAVKDGRLVAGSGLTIDGQIPPPLTILTPGDDYDPARPEYVEGIAQTLRVLGFDARPVVTDFDTVVDLAFTPGEDGSLHYDMYVLGWTLGNPTLPGYYGALFAPDGPMNNTGYESDVFTQALQAYQSSYTKEEARAALWDMERTLATDLPYLPLYGGEITEVYRSDRVVFDIERSLGGIQARLGGIWDVRPVG